MHTDTIERLYFLFISLSFPRKGGQRDVSSLVSLTPFFLSLLNPHIMLN